MNTRYIAAKIIDQFIRNRKSISDLLLDLNTTDNRDKPFIQEIVFGVSRNYFLLKFFLDKLLNKPLEKKHNDIESACLIGLYQLNFMNVPEYAAIQETVNCAILFKKPWAKGLINAVLRKFIREKTNLLKYSQQNEEAFYNHPKWLIDELKISYPNNWQDICNTNNSHPPMSLRINLSKTTLENYLNKLDKCELSWSKIEPTNSGIILNKAMPAESIPGFLEGEFYVQDGGAQLAAFFLDLKQGQYVLDACAAPGGKTTHILDIEPNLKDLIAIDLDEKRLKKISENLNRLGQNAKLICADISNTKDWWDNIQFDRILLDAPCSATGVIRRHPDIKLLRQKDDINNLSKTQLNLLQTLWNTLKPNGLLLYATCSVFPEENDNVIGLFLQKTNDAKIMPLQTSAGIKTKFGLQILPGENNMDGFYYCLLLKIM